MNKAHIMKKNWDDFKEIPQLFSNFAVNFLHINRHNPHTKNP